MDLYVEDSVFAVSDLGQIDGDDIWQVSMNMKKSWHHSFYWGAAYILLIFCLQHYMRNRKPIPLHATAVFWNFTLAIANVGLISIGASEYFRVINTYGFGRSLYDFSIFRNNTTFGYIFHLFLSGKVYELGDTLFIVSRKRPLTYLHVIHHLFTLIVSWYFCAEMFASASLLIAMNVIVHAIMYSYYTLKSLKFNVPDYISMYITLFQMIQLLSGFLMPFYVINKIASGIKCDANYTLCIMCIVMYGVYFTMFANFFYKRYILQVKADFVCNQKLD